MDQVLFQMEYKARIIYILLAIFVNIGNTKSKDIDLLFKKSEAESQGNRHGFGTSDLAGFSYHSDTHGNIPDPQMLDPKDVAVLYQLQTVTQPPVHIDNEDNSGTPSYEEPPARQVTTRAGQTASLMCIVKNIGDRQVSWIRGKDLHVLSSGLNTFATDARVSITASGQVWTLMIHYSQPRDGGAYACQINTQPPIATWFNLTVIEAKANIEGPTTLYVQEGSNISLTCIIKEELVIPGIVLWYHGDALVPRDSPRINVVTKTLNTTTSQLNITDVTISDSGNYSCWPSSGKPDSVLVHVIQGDPPAAMQHGNSSPRPSPQLRALLTLVTWLTPSLILPGWFT